MLRTAGSSVLSEDGTVAAFKDAETGIPGRPAFGWSGVSADRDADRDVVMTGVSMAFKPNYNMQRADRERAKKQKKDEKLRLQQEETARRKASSEPSSSVEEDEPA
jgi:hypothetical protein